MDQVHVPALGAAFGLETLVVELHDVVVFRMHDHDPVVCCDLLHRHLDAAEVHPNGKRLG